MKKLKIILRFSCLFILIRTIIVLSFDVTPTITLHNDSFVGKVISYEKKEDKISLLLKGKENVEVIFYPKKNISFSLGDYYIVTGKIEKIPPNTNFNLFNYQNYMKSKKIFYQIKAEKITLLSKNKNIFYLLKNKVKTRIERFSTRKYLELFLLGEKNYLEKEVLNSFQKNGISHLFAISGMHVTLFAFLLDKILRYFLKREKSIFFLVSSFLLFYLFLANFIPSLLRSVFFYILIRFNKIFNLPFSGKEVLFYLFFLFLLYNPYYLYHVGFIFSFVISFSLLFSQKIINQTKNNISSLFFTSCISFVVSIPILIQNGFAINFLTPLLNCFFIPFVSIFIFPLCLFTFLIPPVEIILKFLLFLLEHLSLFLSSISFLTFTFPKMSLVFHLGYWIIIISIFYHKKEKRYFFILLLIIVLFFHYHISYFNSHTIITFIDVGQGDSTLIALPHQRGNILLDTGGKLSFKGEKSSFSLSQNTLIPYFYSLGIQKIDYLILTHGDFDHMGESIDLIKYFKVKNVIFNCGKQNKLENDLIKVLKKKKIPYYFCIQKLPLKGASLLFFHPQLYGDENNNSNVIYTKIGQYKFLFMGDAGIKVEDKLLKNSFLKNIDVLKVGHHGSKTSSGKNFITFTNPKYSIISVGKNNRYSHPSDSVLKNLSSSKIYRTDLNGSITIHIRKKYFHLKTCIP